jgi:transcriptional regulator with XRE-family HTH domain
MKLAEKLKDWRSQHHYSYRKAGAVVGVSWSTYRNWEEGLAKPSAKYQGKVLAALGISADELLELLAQ